MSLKNPERVLDPVGEHAPVFAALGDATRLRIVVRLSDGQPRSISQLTQNSGLTRQAVAKHLRVLEQAGLVQGVKSGRETLFQFEPKAMHGMREYLTSVSEQWDAALGRLKAFVEEDGGSN